MLVQVERGSGSPLFTDGQGNFDVRYQHADRAKCAIKLEASPIERVIPLSAHVGGKTNRSTKNPFSSNLLTSIAHQLRQLLHRITSL